MKFKLTLANYEKITKTDNLLKTIFTLNTTRKCIFRQRLLVCKLALPTPACLQFSEPFKLIASFKGSQKSL